MKTEEAHKRFRIAYTMFGIYEADEEPPTDDEYDRFVVVLALLPIDSPAVVWSVIDAADGSQADPDFVDENFEELHAIVQNMCVDWGVSIMGRSPRPEC